MATAQAPVVGAVDEIYRLLGDLLAGFPNVYLSTDALTNVSPQIIAPLSIRSEEYCTAVGNKKAGVKLRGHPGGYSAPGDFFIRAEGKDRSLQVRVISHFNAPVPLFSPKMEIYRPYTMEVFSKTAVPKANVISRPPIGIVAHKERGMYTYYSTDTVHESLIGSLIGHLGDLGVAPSLMKYFGTLLCSQTSALEYPEVMPTVALEKQISPELYDLLYPGRGMQSQIVTRAIPTFLMEKLDVEFRKILGSGVDPLSSTAIDHKTIFRNLQPGDFKIWMLQLAHSFYMGKKQYGLLHIDCHLRNVMFRAVKASSRGLPLGYLAGSVAQEIYIDTKPLSQADYLCYQMPFMVDSKGQIVTSGGKAAHMIVENNGLFPKIIDWGQAIADFSKSDTNKDVPIIISNRPENYAGINFGMETILDGNTGNVEYNFIALNIMLQLQRVAHVRNYPSILTDVADKNHASDLYEKIKSFFTGTIYDYSNLITKTQSDSHGKNMVPFSDLHNLNEWYMVLRKVGTTPSKSMVLRLIWAFAINSGAFVDRSGNTVAYFTRNDKPPGIDGNPPFDFVNDITSKTPYIPSDIPQSTAQTNSFSQYLTVNKKYWKLCLLKSGMSLSEIQKLSAELGLPIPRSLKDVAPDICERTSKILLAKTNPSRTIKLPLIGVLDSTSPIWDATSKNIKAGLSYSELALAGFLQKDYLHQILLFTIRFNPGILPGSTIPTSLKNDLRYRSRHRGLDGKTITTGLGQGLDMVNLHLIYIHPSMVPTINFSRNRDLFSASIEDASKYARALTINGGYFVTASLADDVLYPDLEGYRGYPIGFYYNISQPEHSGTVVPIPRAYEKDFGTVFIDGANNIHIVNSATFREQHEQVDTIVFYALENEKHYAVKRKVINFNADRTPMRKSDASIPVYTSAFETGPILIWDSKIVFTTEKMNTALFTVALDDTPAGIVSGNVPKNLINIATPGSPYRVVTDAKNNSMYFNVGDGTDVKFPFRQRSSANLSSHNVLCLTKDGAVLIVVVEGKGYSGIGLDRIQLSELISKFNVEKAVALNAGYGANAVFKNVTSEGSVREWLIDDPYKQKMSVSLTFGMV